MEDAELLAKDLEKFTVEHATALEKMRTDNAEAIQTVQLGAAERVDAVQERAKVAEDKRDVAVGLLKSFMEEREEAIEVINKHHARELHAHGKTIARMKGEIRHWREQNPDGNPYVDEDTPAVEPVAGENEETD